MSSWYARQAVPHRELRSRTKPITPLTRKSSNGRFQNAASVQCGPRRLVNPGKPATISLPTNDSRVELSQISMSQLTDATSYASQASSDGKPNGSYNGYANSSGSSARLTRRGLAIPPARERLRSSGRAPSAQLDKFKQQSYRRSNTISSGVLNHSQQPQVRSSLRVPTTSDQVPGQRNPYLSTVSPYAKAFTSQPKKHQPATKSRSSLFSGNLPQSNRTIATPRTQSNRTIATPRTSVRNHHPPLQDQRVPRNAKDAFLGCKPNQAQNGSAIANRSALGQASVHSRADHPHPKIPLQCSGNKPLGYTQAYVPSTPRTGKPLPFSEGHTRFSTAPQRNVNATFSNKQRTTQIDSQLQDKKSLNSSEDLGLSSKSTGSHGSTPTMFERDIMRKAEEEVKRKVETGVEDKIRPLVSSLEDKQNIFYRRVSKGENRCQELLTSIETHSSDIKSRATNHFEELESNIQKKTDMVMSKLEGEITTKVAGALSKLEEQLAAKVHVGSELTSKIEFAEKMLTMIDTQVSNANGKVSACLGQLDGRVTQAEKWCKKLKNLSDKVEKGVVTLKDAAAKGVASINDAGASFLGKVTDPVLELVQKTVQKTAQNILGQPGFLRAKSPSPKQPGLVFVSPAAEASSQENIITGPSMVGKAATQNVKKSYSKPSRSSKRKTSFNDELVDLTNSPRKKTRHHNVSSPTPNIECHTPKASRRPLGKISRGPVKRRKSSKHSFNFGWDR